MHPLIPAVDLPVNVLLQGWLLLGATLRSCILTEALRHHDEQQRRNNVYPLDTTTAQNQCIRQTTRKSLCSENARNN